MPEHKHLLRSTYLGYITLDAGWKETDDTEDPEKPENPENPEKPEKPENPDDTDGAIGVLVSTPLKNLMLLMFFMRLEILLQFVN